MSKSLISLIAATSLLTFVPLAAPAADAPQKPYVVLDKSLSQLRTDFNANVGKVRMLYIVGPTCGICLRGMSDLQETVYSKKGDDPRIVTFVVHVPTLGAQEGNVAPASRLISNRYTTHYWEETGITGRLMQQVMGVEKYVWDFWAIYAPDVRWSDERLMPAPSFWQHQLGGLPPEKRLDASVFATKVDDIPVAEEIDFVRGNSFRKPFEESLKTVSKVDYYGTRYVDCERYPLEIHTARPNDVRMLMKTGDSSKFEGSRSDRSVKLRGTPQGLGVEEERALLATFDFDTPILELDKNPHAFKPLGMQKLPGILAWKLQVDRPGNYYRILYVDSHYGDIVRFILMNAQGARVLDVALHDYREVEGIRVPFAIDYRGANGTLLASDRLESVAVTRRQS